MALCASQRTSLLPRLLQARPAHSRSCVCLWQFAHCLFFCLRCVCARLLQHTPTLIEAYVAKAKILKHAGDMESAARVADAARRLDLADRYLNCVAVKALFRAGHVSGFCTFCVWGRTRVGGVGGGR